MKKIEIDNTKKIGVIVILTILIIMLMLVIINIFGLFLYKLNIDTNLIRTLVGFRPQKTETIDVNWKEMYPVEKIEEKNINVLTKIKQKVFSLEEKIENRTENILWHIKFLEASYIYDKAISYTLISNSNGLGRLNVDGYWLRQDYKKDENSIEIKADKLKKFNNFVKEKNINLLYVQALQKIEKNSTLLPKFYLNAINNDVDELLRRINGEIDYIDLREKVEVKGKEYLNLFFKTDHHWKPETGIWATGKIVEELNKRYDYNIDKDLIANINNYNIKIYKDCFLGSDGNGVTIANASPEDFSLITPKFTTNLTVKMPDSIPYKNGTFDETLINFKELEFDKFDIYDYAGYSCYVYGNRGLIEIQNEMINDNKRLLIVKDSFANVVSPYLSLGIGHTSVVDLRYFDGSIKKYIEEYNPDTIIILMYPNSLNEESSQALWEFN